MRALRGPDPHRARRSACARASSCWSASASRCCCSCSSRWSTCCPAGRASTTPIDFLAPGRPGPGRHVDRHGQPRHRHRLRAPVRRAQAARRHAARPPAAARGQDRHGAGHRGGPGRSCWCRPRWLLGWEPDGRIALVVPAYLLGTAAFAGIGLLMAGTLRGTVDAGRGQRPLPRAAAARRHDHPADEAARPPSGSSAELLPAARAGPDHAGRVRLAGVSAGPTTGSCWSSGPSPLPLAAARLFRWE